ncbi:hypothetical protein GGR57DRAFT_500657 [Xylariaceae sp. FL1272]|nr:hypothetical protein GGR57DRAFT_500657 [Xylariaceae sp. FL1272]
MSAPPEDPSSTQSVDDSGNSQNTTPDSLAAQGSASASTKRTRVLLSCHPCRISKLKCDRTTPCGQCLKKGKPDGCVYAPRPERSKPSKSMSARLKRLEGMVRGMIELDGTAEGGPGGNNVISQPHRMAGSVVHSEKGTNYVGGTHFMAILEDLEDLKAYFEEDSGSQEIDIDDSDELGPSHLLISPRSQPRNKDELLALLPDKDVMDRLMNRYFNSNSPSQHIIHIPTFTKQYNAFLKDPRAADIHWIATLFIILALGIFFSSFIAPHELELDSSMPAMDRYRQYRGACGWALIRGKFSQPGPFTLQAMMLYTEAEFLVNRVSQTNCYLLCSTLIRLMLKCGLHRDPSKLPSITPYEGEMRRRLWNLGVQIDLLVSFHLGLPCMIHGIESDTAMPRNLLDSDFNEDSPELPPSRPMSDYTPLTYAINKARIARGFGLVARLAHSLTVPSYTEVMRVDSRIQDVWSSVPSYMRIKPMSECITDAPMLVIQRFGLASLYQKSRCVLHRRYLVDPQRLPEHDYSRRTCLEAAVMLLGYQTTMYEACKPGAMLAQNGWFISSLAINDFLLADMILALAAQQRNESDDDLPEWMAACSPPVTKDLAVEMLKRSYGIWLKMAAGVPDCRKAADVVRGLLRRIHAQLGESTAEYDSLADTMATVSTNPQSPPLRRLTLAGVSTPNTNSGASWHTMSAASGSATGPSPQNLGGLNMMDPNLMSMGNAGGDANMMSVDDSWGMSQMSTGYNWNQFDAMTRGADSIPATQIPQAPQDQTWLEQNNYNDFEDFVASNSWNTFPQL